MNSLKEFGEKLWEYEKELNNLRVENLNEKKIIEEETRRINNLNRLLADKNNKLKEVEQLLKGIKQKDNISLLKKSATEAKEKNFILAGNLIGNCLSCGNKWNLKSPGYNYRSCRKCGAVCWIVGDNYPCEICSRIQLMPVVHHINADRSNNDQSNLLFICRDCHIAIHHGIGKSKKSGLSKKRSYKNDKLIQLEIQKYQKLLPKEGIENA